MHIIVVLQLPPRESSRMRVSLESLFARAFVCVLWIVLVCVCVGEGGLQCVAHA